ncbi:50S ribosomal protein L17 [candidate division NPL-UPA2 bacterium Unc8]|uniref:50S ribosomal protein L17 n=1 Tax=candidate division NPL-UPA2 bacterium Unc8 TaxID=1980939 RepID=A0A399FY30_UNCN2|nr:50S ribosomal protein L17 [Bacillota bacterium]MBT9138178.1 50S ribosomal protein L17 [Bacillota bacterium]MBT9146851.1 50S ribosomal protein L17 [Bacillota bacterium]RII00319.1 MAG: 50S ribosomal protein L17 [candidate division NPL-UPA2 bacterium Unc8]
MRHKKGVKKLGLPRGHRHALLANLLKALFVKERIRTTEARGKELKRMAERLITTAQRGDLSSVRNVGRVIGDKEVIRKLFKEIAPRFKDQKSGYTSLVHISPRPGDNAPCVLIELVEKGGKKGS